MEGGLASVPVNVGYAISAIDPPALERAFNTKQRKPHKRHAMIGSWVRTAPEIHFLPPEEASMVKLLIHDLDISLGVVASFKQDHPIVQKPGAETLARSLVEGMLAMLCNAGPVLDELARLLFEAGLQCMGSLANRTKSGSNPVTQTLR